MAINAAYVILLLVLQLGTLSKQSPANAIYDVLTLDEAKEWTRRFLDVHVEHFAGWDCEVEIREMVDDPPPATADASGGLSR